jgi:hypothetical protein
MDATPAVLIHSNVDIGEFQFHLERLVTDFRHGSVGVGEQETMSLSFVASAQQAYLELVLEQFHQILRPKF